MFRGFTIHDIDVGGVRIHARAGGKGPPVLLAGHWFFLAEKPDLPEG